jgi:glutamate racemase
LPLDFAFLDSGTGGIPYMLYLKQKCPEAACVYLADSIHFPYGEKTYEEITADATDAVSLILRTWHPGVVVIACNTISVTALSALRKRFPFVPIVGTVPAIKVAAEISKSRKIGLLATNATIHNPYIERLEHDFAADCTVIARGAPELVSFIEHDFFTATKEERCAAVIPAVSYFAENGCDTIILACTHFLHMADDIQEAAGCRVRVVDSREGVVRQALRVELRCDLSLPKNACTQRNEISAENTVFVTGFTKKSDAEKYNNLCGNLHLKFGGILN